MSDLIGAGSLMVGLGIFIMMLVLSLAFSEFIQERKSHKYRKTITDLYIAGLVRKKAKEDSVDLESEYKEFMKWESMANKDRIKAIDDRIEQSIETDIESKSEKKK